MGNLEASSPTQCNMLVAFTDVAGFAREFDDRTDHEIFGLLAELYQIIEDGVEKSGGKVVKFIGDAALIVYPDNKCGAAVEALRGLKVTTDMWLKDRGFGNDLRIRAHVGRVICGPLGTDREKRFDVIGKTVNEAARLPGDGFTLSPELQALING